MTDRRTMTLNLSSREMELLEELSKRKGVSKTALVRQSIRLYQSLEERLDRGDKIFVEGSEGKDKAELMVL